ncbi:hypothetical protein [Pseudomonas sp. GXZC]|uniref:hypothetical protein n=1 Tax=Pseudomonas sp. GXZC TaxID=3003351 RepID=UPI0022AA29F4|nr:hypothetical protein [Pseudomonas sp. GXZC]WAT32109.1 hypothetical protein OZ428_34170 [Pseudomonas sp. GXZC]
MAEKSEPTISALSESQTLEDMDRIEQPADEGLRSKKSWSGVASSLANNRPALLIAFALAVGVGVFAYRKSHMPTDAATNTVVNVVPPAGEGRAANDPRVKGLDGKVEVAALEEAKQTNGTYVPPLAGPTAPLAPKVDAAPKPPLAPQPPAGDGQSNKAANTQQAQADLKRAEAMEKALAIQLARISERVDGPAQVASTAHVLDVKKLDEALVGGVDSTTRTGLGGNGKPSTKLGYPMGTIWTAVLPGGADTDRPGTIQADIEQGPFAGRKALCNFTWPSREYLNLECFAVQLDKESIPIKMVAVGADQMPNVKAEFNGRYIQRAGALFLVAFPAAYADGLSRGGTTVVSNGGTTSTQDKLSGGDLAIYAAGKATEPLLKEAQKMAGEIKPQAKVPPMQIIGLMLAEDI